MQAPAGKWWRPAGLLGAIGLCVALATACDTGGAAPATATPVAGSVLTSTLTGGASTPAGTTPAATATGSTAATAPASPAATNTAVAAAATVAPNLTPGVAPTAARKGNPVSGLNWRLMGLTGQDVFALAGTGQLDAPLYLGGTGVYRSADQGQTWNQLSFDNRTRVDRIVVSRSNPQILFAGSGTGCAGGLPGAQFRSGDGGATWKALPQAPASLEIDAKNPDLLTAITCENVVRSSDGGQTWTPLPDAGIKQLGTRSGDTVRVAPADSSVLYAVYISEGGTSRIRVSSDGGKTWAGETDYPGVSDLLVDAKRPQRAWALTQSCTDKTCYGVLRTIDGGQSWLSSVTGLDAAHNTSSAGSGGAYQLAGLAAQYSSTGDLVELYTGSFATESLPGAGIFGSKDGGQVWSRFGGDLGGRAIHTLFVALEKAADTGTPNALLYAGTDDGVHRIFLNAAH